MDNKTININTTFVDGFYAKYLQKRFGINSCSRQDNSPQLFNKKILSDITMYRDISSPVINDRLIENSCRRVFGTNTIETNWPENYYNRTCPPPNRSINTIPSVILPVNFRPIEVTVGTQQAINMGIIDGNTTIFNENFANRDVEIFRGNINVAYNDPQNGDSFFTKDFESPIITLSIALILTERIKIKIL